MALTPSATAKSNGTLRDGDLCHDFLMKTIDQKVLEAGDYRGQKIWLAFYRYAGCPLCASHLAQVIEAKSLLTESNITFVAIYDCAPKNIPAWVKKNANERLQIVADATQGLHEQFGATKSYAKLFSPGSALAWAKATAEGHFQGALDGSLSMMPAHILVDETGRVVCAYYAMNAGDNIPWKIVRSFAEMSAPAVDDRTQVQAAPTQAPAEFAVNYKWKLKLGSETDFLAAWIKLEEQTRRQHSDYLGARLYLDSEQYVAAFSMWANKASWEKYWITKEQSLPDYLRLNAYVERTFEPQICRSIFDSLD